MGLNSFLACDDGTRYPPGTRVPGYSCSRVPGYCRNRGTRVPALSVGNPINTRVPFVVDEDDMLTTQITRWISVGCPGTR
eukprot:1300839-Rhodomonas_salina.1